MWTLRITSQSWHLSRSLEPGTPNFNIYIYIYIWCPPPPTYLPFFCFLSDLSDASTMLVEIWSCITLWNNQNIGFANVFLALGAENIGRAHVFHDFHDFPTIGWMSQIPENHGNHWPRRCFLHLELENIGKTNVFHDFHDFPTIGWGHSWKIMENIGPANVFCTWS